MSVGFAGAPIAALVDGAQILVKDGKGYRDPRAHVIQDHHAETFACVSRDSRHLLLGTVDMRDWRTEAGVTMNQLRTYLLGKKCWSAMAFDGGGSATLDYRLPSSSSVVTVNHPADGQERRIPDALLVYYQR
jgi:exopolysaccharide biosynthesis protein